MTTNDTGQAAGELIEAALAWRAGRQAADPNSVAQGHADEKLVEKTDLFLEAARSNPRVGLDMCICLSCRDYLGIRS